MTRPPSWPQLELEQVDQVAVVRLNNPRRANALSNATFGEDLPDLLADLGRDPAVRVIVLTGAGEAFCAGTELDADGFEATAPASTMSLLRRAHRSIAALRAMSKPSLAAVNGAAIGAGLGLALSCDIRIASPTSRYSVPYVRMGLTPDMGTSLLLREAVGLANALDLVLTGRMIDAIEAKSLGLVSRVAEDPLDEALVLSKLMASNPEAAVASAKALVHEGPRRGMEWLLTHGEPQAFASVFHSPQFQAQFSRYRTALATRGENGDSDGR